MTKRTDDVEDIKAGNALRESMLDMADAKQAGAPLWHGWAIMDAFLAGVEYERMKNRKRNPT